MAHTVQPSSHVQIQVLGLQCLTPLPHEGLQKCPVWDSNFRFDVGPYPVRGPMCLLQKQVLGLHLPQLVRCSTVVVWGVC